MRPGQTPLNALTGLRFWAAFAIFLHHYTGRLNTTDTFHAFSLGAGVSFFFVLSGFIMGYVYAEGRHRLDRSDFYKRRFFRIWPLHVVTMLLVIATVPSYQVVNAQNATEVALSLALLHSWTGLYDFALVLNGPAWSISTEFGFYLAFPFLLLAYRQIGLVFLGLLGLKLAAMALFTVPGWAPTVAEVIHMNPLFRLYEFALGLWFARIFLESSKRERAAPHPALQTVLEAVSLALVLLFIYRPFLDWLLIDLIPGVSPWVRQVTTREGGFLAFALLILVYARGGGVLSALMGSRIMVFLGEISFSLYLVHVVIIRPVQASWANLSGLWNIEVFLIVLAFSLLASYCLYTLVESPFRLVHLRGFRRSFGDAWSRFRTGPVLAASVAMLAIYGFVWHAPKRPYLSEPGWAMAHAGVQLDVPAPLARAGVIALSTRVAASGVCYDIVWRFDDLRPGRFLRRSLYLSYGDTRGIFSQPRWIVTESNTEKAVEVFDRVCQGQRRMTRGGLPANWAQQLDSLAFDLVLNGPARPGKVIKIAFDLPIPENSVHGLAPETAGDGDTPGL